MYSVGSDKERLWTNYWAGVYIMIDIIPYFLSVVKEFKISMRQGLYSQSGKKRGIVPQFWNKCSQSVFFYSMLV
jgi:hypothetical protein